MASQGNYKPTTGKATGNGRHYSIAMEWLERQLGFFWFTLLLKTRTHGPGLRSKYAYKKQDVERMGGDKTQKKNCLECFWKSRRAPQRGGNHCYTQNLWQLSWWQWDKYTLKSMNQLGQFWSTLMARAPHSLLSCKQLSLHKC